MVEFESDCGRFVRTDEVLGAGRATVFRGRDLTTGLEVAIKIHQADWNFEDKQADADRTGSLIGESERRLAAVLALTSGPCHGTSAPWIVLELLDPNRYSPLAELSNRQGKLESSARAKAQLETAIELYEGLFELNRIGLHHFDIDLDNVCWDSRSSPERPALIIRDFGSVESGTKTLLSSIVRGKQPYLPPEVRAAHDHLARRQAERELTAEERKEALRRVVPDRVDSYMAGLVMSQVVLGRCPENPLTADEARELRRRTPELAAAVEPCLRTDPLRRAGVTETRDRLYLAREDVVRRNARQASLRRRRLQAALVLVILSGMIGFAAELARRWREEQLAGSEAKQRVATQTKALLGLRDELARADEKRFELEQRHAAEVRRLLSGEAGRLRFDPPPEIWPSSGTITASVQVPAGIQAIELNGKERSLIDGRAELGEIKLSPGENHTLTLVGADRRIELVLPHGVDSEPPRLTVIKPASETRVSTTGPWLMTLALVDRSPCRVVLDHRLDGSSIDRRLTVWSEGEHPLKLDCAREGRHELRVSAVDAAGHRVELTLTRHVDLEPPRLTLLVGQELPSRHEKGRIKLTTSEPLRRLVIDNLELEPPSVGSTPVIVTVSPRVETLDFTLEDLAGNRASGKLTLNRPDFVRARYRALVGDPDFKTLPVEKALARIEAEITRLEAVPGVLKSEVRATFGQRHAQLQSEISRLRADAAATAKAHRALLAALVQSEAKALKHCLRSLAGEDARAAARDARASLREAGVEATVIDVVISPIEAEIFVKFGNLLRERGPFYRDQARVQYLTAIKLDDTNFDAHFGLGILLMESGYAGEAAEHFYRALEGEAPSTTAQSRAHYQLAFLNRTAEGEGIDRAKALKHARKAVEFSTGDAIAERRLLRSILTHAGQIDEARKVAATIAGLDAATASDKAALKKLSGAAPGR